MTIELAGDSAERRKARGAFFTPAEITTFLSGWAIRSGSDRVLEPSCGDGAFLAEAVERLQSLGGRAPIQAHELHESSAADARAVLSESGHPGDVRVGDFLATTAEPMFDAVVGNPPYVRYQGFTGEARAAGLAAALAQGVRLSRLSSSWAPFVIHAAGYLVPAGRLALVLPAELLSSNYAQEVRDFLIARFATVQVVLVARQVFPGVQTEAVLLLAEGRGGTDRVSFATVDDTRGLDAARFSTTLRAKPGERWTSALVSPDASSHLDALLARGVMSHVADWGRLSLGAVTGNNRYFTMSPAQATALGLRADDTVAISPPGSSHLRRLWFDTRDHSRLGDEEERTLLFRPDKPSAAARAYIASGEELEVDQAYKCRVRTPWWRTPLPAPPDLFITYMNQDTPQLASNPGHLHYLNSVHGLYLTADLADLADVLPLAALNTATAFSAEVTGRAYGGGVLKLEPREAARLVVPAPAEVRRQRDELRRLLPTARTLLAHGRIDDVRVHVDSIVLDDGRASDGLALMRAAHDRLSQRRHVRAAGYTNFHVAARAKRHSAVG